MLVNTVVQLGEDQLRQLGQLLSQGVLGREPVVAHATFNAVVSRLADTATDLQASAADIADRMQEVVLYLRTAAADEFVTFLGGRSFDFRLVADFLVRRRRRPEWANDAALAHAAGLTFEALLDLNASRQQFVRAIELQPRNILYARSVTESCLFSGEFIAAEQHALHWYDLVKDEPGADAELSEALNSVGSALVEQVKLDPGLQAMEAALHYARRSGQPRLVSLALNNLGAIYNLLGLHREAETELLESRELREAHREPIKNLALTLNNLSAAYRYQDRLQEAEDVLHDTNARLHRELPRGAAALRPSIYAQTLNNLGSLRLIDFQDPEGALPYFVQALDSLAVLEDWAPNVAITLHNIAYAHVCNGRSDLAAAYYRRAIRGATTLYGVTDYRTAHIVAEAAKHCREIPSPSTRQQRDGLH